MVVAVPMMGNRGQSFQGLALNDATMFGRVPHMIKVTLTRLGVAAGGLALSLAAGAGIASAAPDLGPAVNTTCSYPQLVSALNAQGPEAGAQFNKSPMLQAGLRQFLASDPAKRQQMAQNVLAAPAFAPFIPQVEQAFLTCNNF
jgi:hemophore-related protein